MVTDRFKLALHLLIVATLVQDHYSLTDAVIEETGENILNDMLASLEGDNAANATKGKAPLANIDIESKDGRISINIDVEYTADWIESYKEIVATVQKVRTPAVKKVKSLEVVKKAFSFSSFCGKVARFKNEPKESPAMESAIAAHKFKNEINYFFKR